MSEALRISKYSNSFIDKLPAKVVKDLKKSTGDTFKTKEDYYKQINEIVDTSAALGTTSSFDIANSFGYISNLWVELKGTGVSVYDIGQWGIANALATVEIRHGSTVMCSYTGAELVKMIHLCNKDERILAELNEIAGNGDMDCKVMCIPLLAPGSNLKYCYDSYDVRAPAWAIGACNTKLRVNITLASGLTISTGTAFELSSLSLKFMSYSLENDNISNVKPTKSGIFYSWNYFQPIGNTYPITLTDATEAQFTINNVIQQGMLDGIIIDVLDVTTKVADVEFYDTEPIDKLNLSCHGNNYLYKHDSVNEAKMHCMREWKISNKIYNTAANYGYIYPIPLTGRPDLSSITGNIGSKGLNLNDNKPTIKLTCTALTNSGTLHRVHVLAIYKAIYRIMNNKSCQTDVYI